MQECKITFGRLLWGVRRNRRFSQGDLCKIISNEYNHSIDCYELSKIENNRLEIRSIEYNWLVPIIAEIFHANIEWLEQIRQQTEPQPLNLSKAMFSNEIESVKITIGSLLKNQRQSHQITRWELANMFNRHLDLNIFVDMYWILELENNHIDIQQTELDWLIPVILKVFGKDFDREVLEQIRQQTEPQPLDLSQGMFPIYFKP